MWKIRKGKSTPVPVSQKYEPPNDAVPKFLARQILMLARVLNLASDEMERVFRVLPPDQKTVFEHLAKIDIRPSFYDVMKLIDVSEQRGLLSPDEAASIRAGKVRCIDNPIPDIERNDDSARA